MNETLVENYRSVVKEEDEVYFLGDLTLARGGIPDSLRGYLDRMPGTKHLILGNHDKLRNPFLYHELGFSSVHTALMLDIGMPEEVYMAHDPAWAQIPNTLWICGHVHGNWKRLRTDKGTKIINVGVDVWNYTPVSVDRVIKEGFEECR